MKYYSLSIPRTQDCLDTVTGVTLFSTIDIVTAYYQIPMAKSDFQKTAFIIGACALWVQSNAIWL